MHACVRLQVHGWHVSALLTFPQEVSMTRIVGFYTSKNVSMTWTTGFYDQWCAGMHQILYLDVQSSMHGGFYAPGIEVLCLVIDEFQISKSDILFQKSGFYVEISWAYICKCHACMCQTLKFERIRTLKAIGCNVYDSLLEFLWLPSMTNMTVLFLQVKKI